jgi:hypothetical protein
MFAMKDWEERVAKRRHELGGMTEAEMLRAAELNVGYLSNLRKRGVSPTIETLNKIVRALNWTLRDLFADAPRKELKLRYVNEIRGGEMWTPAPGTAREFPLSVLEEDLVSFEVTTDDYRSAGYQRGDIVAGPRSLGEHLDNIIGRDCIIETTKGERYFKILQRGSSPGLFTLASFDPRHPERNVSNVKIKWAAPIKLIVRN